MGRGDFGKKKNASFQFRLLEIKKITFSMYGSLYLGWMRGSLSPWMFFG
jgi:hypothetical protein